MVAPLVAAAAPTVIASATDNDGLVNKLFKVGVLVGGLILIAISLSILYFVFDLFGLLGSGPNAIVEFGKKLPLIGPLINAGDLALTGFTFVISAFGFLGRRS